MEKIKSLMNEPKVINVGLDRFFKNITENETKVVNLEWNPPAQGNTKLIDILFKTELISEEGEC